MGKALYVTQKNHLHSLGARVPQSFRSGIVYSDQGLLGCHGVDVVAANDCHHPLRNATEALQVDAFWRDAHTREPYYVPGRGYDQYRPAYALGSRAAFVFSASEFRQFEQELERHWESHDNGSLLDWGQVREAVYAAWMRARQLQARGSNFAIEGNLGSMLRSLYRLQLHTAYDLRALMNKAEPAPSSFLRQVIDRHVVMLEGFAQELSLVAPNLQAEVNPFLQIGTNIHYAWTWLRSWVTDIDAECVLRLCDKRERQLIALYMPFLGASPFVSELASILKRQAHRLHSHHGKFLNHTRFGGG